MAGLVLPATAPVWQQALVQMPRIRDKDVWNRLSLVTKWLVGVRAAVLPMTVSAALLPVLLAKIETARVTGDDDGNRFGGAEFFVRSTSMLVALTLAHATNNILNDISDHTRGVDRGDAFRLRYGTQPVEQKFWTLQQAYLWAFATGAPALVIGAWLSLTTPHVWPFFLAGIALVFGYSWPLKHFGLGELAVLIAWGPLIVGGGYLVLTGQWMTRAALASLPFALGPTSLLLGKHTDKLPWDMARGVRTLPVMLGEQAARRVTLGCIVSQYVLVLVLVFVTHDLPWQACISLATARWLPKVLRVFWSKAPARSPEGYPEGLWPLWFSAHAFMHQLYFSLFYLFGLTLAAVMTV